VSFIVVFLKVDQTFLLAYPGSRHIGSRVQARSLNHSNRWPAARVLVWPLIGDREAPFPTAAPHGMVFGMATTKITITLHDEQVKEIRDLVAAGQAANVSAFVQHAVRVALHDAAGWKEMLEEALRQTGGPLTRREREWADALLSPREQKRRAKKGKAA